MFQTVILFSVYSVSQREDSTHKEVTYRKLSEIDLAQLVNNMSLEMIKTENLDDMVTMPEENFSTALNNQAPELTKVITVRKKKTMVWK